MPLEATVPESALREEIPFQSWERLPGSKPGVASCPSETWWVLGRHSGEVSAFLEYWPGWEGPSESLRDGLGGLQQPGPSWPSVFSQHPLCPCGFLCPSFLLSWSLPVCPVFFVVFDMHLSSQAPVVGPACLGHLKTVQTRHLKEGHKRAWGMQGKLAPGSH